MLIERMVRQSEEDVEGRLASKRGVEKRFLVEETLFEIQISL